MSNIQSFHQSLIEELNMNSIVLNITFANSLLSFLYNNQRFHFKINKYLTITLQKILSNNLITAFESDQHQQLFSLAASLILEHTKCLARWISYMLDRQLNLYQNEVLLKIKRDDKKVLEPIISQKQQYLRKISYLFEDFVGYQTQNNIRKYFQRKREDFPIWLHDELKKYIKDIDCIGNYAYQFQYLHKIPIDNSLTTSITQLIAAYSKTYEGFNQMINLQLFRQEGSKMRRINTIQFDREKANKNIQIQLQQFLGNSQQYIRQNTQCFKDKDSNLIYLDEKQRNILYHAMTQINHHDLQFDTEDNIRRSLKHYSQLLSAHIDYLIEEQLSHLEDRHLSEEKKEKMEAYLCQLKRIDVSHYPISNLFQSEVHCNKPEFEKLMLLLYTYDKEEYIKLIKIKVNNKEDMVINVNFILGKQRIPCQITICFDLKQKIRKFQDTIIQFFKSGRINDPTLNQVTTNQLFNVKDQIMEKDLFSNNPLSKCKSEGCHYYFLQDQWSFYKQKDQQCIKCFLHSQDTENVCLFLSRLSYLKEDEWVKQVILQKNKLQIQKMMLQPQSKGVYLLIDTNKNTIKFQLLLVYQQLSTQRLIMKSLSNKQKGRKLTKEYIQSAKGSHIYLKINHHLIQQFLIQNHLSNELARYFNQYFTQQNLKKIQREGIQQVNQDQLQRHIYNRHQMIILNVRDKEVLYQQYKEQDLKFIKRIQFKRNEQQVQFLRLATGFKWVSQLSLKDVDLAGQICISDFHNLAMIDLSMNSLTKVTFKSNQALKRVNLEHNNLSSVHFQDTICLQTLSLEHNNFKGIFQHSILSLKYLNISYNYINELNLEQCTSLREIECQAYDPIPKLAINFNHLEKLGITLSNVKDLQNLRAPLLQSLHLIIKKNNSKKSENTNALQKFLIEHTNLEWIMLSINQQLNALDLISRLHKIRYFYLKSGSSELIKLRVNKPANEIQQQDQNEKKLKKSMDFPSNIQSLDFVGKWFSNYSFQDLPNMKNISLRIPTHEKKCFSFICRNNSELTKLQLKFVNIDNFIVVNCQKLMKITLQSHQYTLQSAQIEVPALRSIFIDMEIKIFSLKLSSKEIRKMRFLHSVPQTITFFDDFPINLQELQVTNLNYQKLIKSLKLQSVQHLLYIYTNCVRDQLQLSTISPQIHTLSLYPLDKSKKLQDSKIVIDLPISTLKYLGVTAQLAHLLLSNCSELLIIDQSTQHQQVSKITLSNGDGRSKMVIFRLGKDKIDNMKGKVEIKQKGVRCAFVNNMVNYLQY